MYYYGVAQQAAASEVLDSLYNADRCVRPVTGIISYDRVATTKG